MSEVKHTSAHITVNLNGIPEHSEIDIYISKKFMNYIQNDSKPNRGYINSNKMHLDLKDKGYDSLVLLTGASNGFLNIQTLPSEDDESYCIVTKPDKESYRLNCKYTI